MYYTWYNINMEKLIKHQNGQWELLNKAASYTTKYHSSYNHDNGNIHQYSIYHGDKHVASGYIHDAAAGHKADAPVISPEGSEHAHHNNAAAMSALRQHIGKDPR